MLQRLGGRSDEYRQGQPVALRRRIKGRDQERFVAMPEIVSQVSDALHEAGMTGSQKAA
ncbi:MAG: hypothetical protein H7338_18245 [Candidatus Sericytochromatia bacterium]|nr:hypothetical protein [Candidatus Sericytochromatia bacterium]